MNKENLQFGELVRSIRVKQEIGLREFCQKIDYDPSNWSKIERGVLLPPEDEKVLQKWAGQLGIKKDSKEWYEFFDCAALERGKIPSYVREDKELLAKLPVFFRTISGEKPSQEDLENLFEFLKSRHK